MPPDLISEITSGPFGRHESGRLKKPATPEIMAEPSVNPNSALGMRNRLNFVIHSQVLSSNIL